MPPQTATIDPTIRTDISESTWRKLLGRIRDGLVVPVLGPQLLDGTGDAPGLQAFVARKLLETHELGHDATALTPGRELHDVVTRLRPTTALQDIYEEVHEAIAAFTKARPTPTAIKQLAEISDFRLLVTVTPDDMLARCLKQRCAVNEIIHSPNLSMSSAQQASPPRRGRQVRNDLPDDWEERTDEVHLLYLFGKSQRTPVFAIHEEDVLEYTHNVISRGSNAPINFVTELQSKDLLFIGCRFPDWLSRFFLRATNKERLSLERRKREWLIEELEPQGSLTLFLTSYSKYTEVLSHAGPAAFVQKLYDRWKLTDTTANVPADAPADTPRDLSPARGASRCAALFFISYSRETDRDQAAALRQQLLDLGAREHEVWFDKSTIEPGNDFRMSIENAIDDCEYFLPILSRKTDARPQGFVFNEWDLANARLPSLNRDFIVPVIIEDEYEPEGYLALPTHVWKRRNIHFGHAPGGKPDEELRKRLRTLLRAARERGGGT